LYILSPCILPLLLEDTVSSVGTFVQTSATGTCTEGECAFVRTGRLTMKTYFCFLFFPDRAKATNGATMIFHTPPPK
jgi:hypothetical protein